MKWGVVSKGCITDRDGYMNRPREGQGDSTTGGEDKLSSGNEESKMTNSQLALARQFLEMISYGQGAKIFTYVLMLDGELRFTVRSHRL